MKAKLIRTAQEHEKALKHVEALMDAEAGSAQEEELDLWTLLIERYEQEQFPIEEPDPIEAIKFRMDQLGMERKDLRDYLGQKGRVSEVLNRKRSLSLTMIRALHDKLGIPAETLIQKPTVTKSVRGKRKLPTKQKATRGKATKGKATKKRTSKKQASNA